MGRLIFYLWKVFVEFPTVHPTSEQFLGHSGLWISSWRLYPDGSSHRLQVFRSGRRYSITKAVSGSVYGDLFALREICVRWWNGRACGNHYDYLQPYIYLCVFVKWFAGNGKTAEAIRAIRGVSKNYFEKPFTSVQALKPLTKAEKTVPSNIILTWSYAKDWLVTKIKRVAYISTVKPIFHPQNIVINLFVKEFRKRKRPIHSTLQTVSWNRTHLPSFEFHWNIPSAVQAAAILFRLNALVLSNPYLK